MGRQEAGLAGSPRQSGEGFSVRSGGCPSAPSPQASLQRLFLGARIPSAQRSGGVQREADVTSKAWAGPLPPLPGRPL